MGSLEIVLNELLGEFLVKDGEVGVEIPEVNELFLHGTIETFVLGVVFRCSYP